MAVLFGSALAYLVVDVGVVALVLFGRDCGIGCVCLVEC